MKMIMGDDRKRKTKNSERSHLFFTYLSSGLNFIRFALAIEGKILVFLAFLASELKEDPERIKALQCLANSLINNFYPPFVTFV